jgi:pimeloyl-ACP methyl ester carboxylesterase
LVARSRAPERHLFRRGLVAEYAATVATAVAHDGTTIDIDVHGSGPTILMHPLPAYPGFDAETLALKRRLDEGLVPQLSDRFRLVMFEYPGDPKPATLTPTNVVRDLLAIADAAEADRFTWCGYSWTAVIGLQLAIATDRLSGLICGGWPPLDAPYPEVLQVVNAAREYEGPLQSASQALFQQFITFYEPLQSFEDAPIRQISCPRLCVAGTADNMYGVGLGARIMAQREELERLGWDVRFVDGLEHMEVLEPSVFIPLIGEWLDQHIGTG